MRLQLKISDWNAVAVGLCADAEWYEWAETGQRRNEDVPAFELIPANMRRRMSLASKLAVQVAMYLSAKHRLDYAVFVSRHGELPRTYQLINEIIAGEEASPISFSQSVHNTSSGLFTIASNTAIPVTSLASCADSFQQAIVEAIGRLSSIPDSKLLLVCFDDNPPDVYSPFVEEEAFPYAVGLILENGKDWLVESKEQSVEVDTKLPQALQFQKYFLAESANFFIQGTRQNWIWTCLK